MSFRRLLDRTITLYPRVRSGLDARGNEVWADGTPVEVSAARQPVDLSEDTADDRDQQLGRWIYFLLPTAAALALTGRDELEDAGHRYRIIGEPDVVVRLRGGRPHHVEAVAERIH